MNAVDTNVLVYRLDRSEPAKQRKARELLRKLASGSDPGIMPWQVLAVGAAVLPQ
jgi:predicted nucleic acid-binding protein